MIKKRESIFFVLQVNSASLSADNSGQKRTWKQLGKISGVGKILGGIYIADKSGHETYRPLWQTCGIYMYIERVVSKNLASLCAHIRHKIEIL